MKKIPMALIVLALLPACSSTQVAGVPEAQPDVVISRMEGFGSRPDFIRESEPFRIKDGNVVSLGMATIPGDQRVEAAYRIAENNAKAVLASAIEQRLDFIFQNAEEGGSLDTTQARYIGAEATRISAFSLRLAHCYYEKVLITGDGGLRRVVYRVFATVTMPEVDFRRAIVDAIRRHEGKHGLSEDFARKVDEHWDQFVNGRSAPEKAPAVAEK